MPEFEDFYSDDKKPNDGFQDEQAPDDEDDGPTTPPGFIKIPMPFGSIMVGSGRMSSGPNINPADGDDGNVLSKASQAKVLGSLEFPLSKCPNMYDAATFWSRAGEVLADHDQNCKKTDCVFYFPDTPEGKLEPATPERFKKIVLAHLKLCPDMETAALDEARSFWEAADSVVIRFDARYMLFKNSYDTGIILGEIKNRMNPKADFFQT